MPDGAEPLLVEQVAVTAATAGIFSAGGETLRECGSDGWMLWDNREYCPAGGEVHPS